MPWGFRAQDNARRVRSLQGLTLNSTSILIRMVSGMENPNRMGAYHETPAAPTPSE